MFLNFPNCPGDEHSPDQSLSHLFFSPSAPGFFLIDNHQFTTNIKLGHSIIYSSLDVIPQEREVKIAEEERATARKPNASSNSKKKGKNMPKS